MNIDNKNSGFNIDIKATKEKTKFVPKRYPRPWQMELTEKERENLRKMVEEDTKLYKELSKRIDQDSSQK